MWIYVWDTEIKWIYLWDTPVKEVYLWDTKVRPKPKTFTISWTEQSNMSSWWTYSDDAAWLTAGSTAFDEFFWYSAVKLSTAWVETAEVTQTSSGWAWKLKITDLWTITSGDNVMIKFPVRWIKMSKSWSVVTLSITEELNKTWYQYYAHSTWTLSNPWTPKDAFYLWAYKWCLANPRLKSWSWQRPIMSETQSTFCTYAKANGSWYNIEWFYQRMYVNALYMMKYWNPNSRSRIWNWYIWWSSAQYTWSTNSITNATWATNTSTTWRIKLFWLEDRWGNVGEEMWGAYSTYKNWWTHIFVTLNNWSWQASWWEDTWTVVNYNYNNMSAIAGDNKTMFMSIAWVWNSNYDTYYSAYSFAGSDNRMPLAWYWYNAWSLAGALTMTFNYASSQYDARWGTRLMYLNWLT